MDGSDSGSCSEEEDVASVALKASQSASLASKDSSLDSYGWMSQVARTCNRFAILATLSDAVPTSVASTASTSLCEMDEYDAFPFDGENVSYPLPILTLSLIHI